MDNLKSYRETYFFMEVSEISDNGQVIIPIQLREKYNFNVGDTILLEEKENGILLVSKTKLSKLTGIYPEKGLLDDLNNLRQEERAIL